MDIIVHVTYVFRCVDIMDGLISTGQHKKNKLSIESYISNLGLQVNKTMDESNWASNI